MRTKIGQLAAKLAEELSPERWANIDTLRQQAEATGLLDQDDVELKAEVWNWFTGEIVRKAMRRKDDEGFPLFPSIRVPVKDGDKTERRYMSEKRMKTIHYAQFYNECDGNESYWRHLKNLTAQRCVSRYGPQGDLFPGWREQKAG